MKLIDGKSVLLGIGIGIVITSILGFIFFLGYQPQLSDSEIISRARELGMVDRFEAESNIRRNQDGSVTFIVSEGESSSRVAERLYDAGLIDSSIEFEIMLKKANLQDAIKPGEYRIYFDDDTRTIIDKLTGR
ncbi:MAG: endolytic transglycosylase MltG [Clostridiaceae bacterium]|nr:endolytic transglycosylase MltG [Clostridiaceae bacterium]